MLLLALAGCRIDRDADGHPPPMDCDDADAAVHPAAAEACGNDVDDDCDGRAVGCGPAGWSPLADADARVLAPAHSGLRWSLGQLANVGDLDGDGLDDRAVRASVYSVPLTGVWLLPGALAGDDRMELDEATISGVLHGEALGGGDLDGDGLAELVLDARASDESARIHVLPPGAGLRERDAQAVLRPDDALPEGRFTSPTLLVAGDTDGDGIGDLLVADPYAGFAGRSAGAVWLVPGPIVGAIELDRLDAVHGAAAGQYAGYALAAADLDGDGLSDAIVLTDGGVRLLRGPITPGTLAFADAFISAAAHTVAAADADGDGYGDVLVGAPGDASGETTGATPPGAAFLFRGPLDGEVSSVEAVATIFGEPGTRDAGYAVALPGDLDGDGTGELVLTGSVGWGGAVFVFPGSAAGTFLTIDADAVIYSEDSLNGARSLAGGDGDGDGFAELLIVGPAWMPDDSDSDRESAVHLVRGGPGF